MIVVVCADIIAMSRHWIGAVRTVSVDTVSSFRAEQALHRTGTALDHSWKTHGAVSCFLAFSLRLLWLFILLIVTRRLEMLWQSWHRARQNTTTVLSKDSLADLWFTSSEPGRPGNGRQDGHLCACCCLGDCPLYACHCWPLMQVACKMSALFFVAIKCIYSGNTGANVVML